MPLDKYNRIGSFDDISDPIIREFTALVGDDGIIDFKTLKQKDFVKYWPSMSIHRYEDGDFTYIFYGTQLVQNIGTERTGDKVLALTNHNFKRELFDNLLDVLTTKKVMFLIGSLEGNDRGYIKWQQVKVPLRRGGEINEVLSLFSFQPLIYESLA
jgi:hypothetical protein